MLLVCLWFAAVYGVANAVAVLNFGKLYVHPITDKIPVVRHMVRCVSCASMWIGVLGSWAVFSPTKLAWVVAQATWPVLELPVLPLWKLLLVDGAAASAVSYLLWSFTEWLVPTVHDTPTENSAHLPDVM